jgi:uncharacterized protein (DUF58 family)
MLIIDISASSRFSHTKHLKSELIAEMAALLAFSAIKNQDNVGLLLFSNEIELYLKPKKGLKHVLRVIRELLFFQPKHQGTNLQRALSFLGNVEKKHSVCFLISDFLMEPLFHEIVITAKRHELIGIELYDEYEQIFPSTGLVSLHDLESNQKMIIDSSDPLLQKNYQETSKYRQLSWKQAFNKAGAEWISIRSDESYTQALYRFFKFRHKK